MSALMPASPLQFLAELFRSRAAATGAVVWQWLRDAERFIARDAFPEGMRRCGYSVVENAGKLEIYCNREPIRRLT
ncbi:MAG: N-(5'-phosphoribosyl)anthranilate isomerase [Tabrizicola sp.]|nr:N-(5'-phosphoribosyl)anthranilate isomerase [Tabrizicola sp.]